MVGLLVLRLPRISMIWLLLAQSKADPSFYEGSYKQRQHDYISKSFNSPGRFEGKYHSLSVDVSGSGNGFLPLDCPLYSLEDI